MYFICLLSGRNLQTCVSCLRVIFTLHFFICLQMLPVHKSSSPFQISPSPENPALWKTALSRRSKPPPEKLGAIFYAFQLLRPAYRVIIFSLFTKLGFYMMRNKLRLVRKLIKLVLLG